MAGKSVGERLLVKSLRVNLVCGGEKSVCEMSLGENPPAPEVQGAWSSGWHKSTKVQVYLGGGAFIWKKTPVFDRSWRSPSQNTVKNSTE